MSTFSLGDASDKISGMVFAETIIHSAENIVQNICTNPGTDWIIISDCTIINYTEATGNVEIQNNSLVTIESSGTLDIDFATKFLKVHQGSGILVKSGGKITSRDVVQLFPTIPGGREWYSKWDNGNPRTITDVNRDPDDSMFELRGRGDPQLVIDGNGVATLSGTQPRMYVNDPQEVLKWKNTEITVYAKRISESSVDDNAGFIFGARSNHSNNDGCNVDTYYSRMKYDGIANFAKELDHETGDSESRPVNNKIDWEGDGTLPYNEWIGHKFVIRNYDNDSKVRLQMYLDEIDSLNGGNWNLVAALDDHGNWPVPPNLCGIPLTKIILEANPSVFIRNTDISSAQYKKFSIREIEPLP